MVAEFDLPRWVSFVDANLNVHPASARQFK
jgi:hypothetical protein